MNMNGIEFGCVLQMIQRLSHFKMYVNNRLSIRSLALTTRLEGHSNTYTCYNFVIKKKPNPNE